MPIKPAGNNTPISDAIPPNQPQAASAVPEEGTEVTEGALENTNMGDQGSKATRDINEGNQPGENGSPEEAAEQASVAGKVQGNNDPADEEIGDPEVSKPDQDSQGHGDMTDAEARKPTGSKINNEAVDGTQNQKATEQRRDGNSLDQQATNKPDPTGGDEHINKRIVSGGGPLHTEEDNSGVDENGENLPRIYDPGNVKLLQNGQRFFAVWAFDPQSDDGRYAEANIESLRSGRIIRRDIPQSYWNEAYKTRPPIAMKEKGGYSMQG